MIKRTLIASVLTVASLFLSLAPQARASATVVSAELAQAVAERESKVPEFQFIRTEADRRGLRVWLFGGTAAGFIHYVKWDLLRQKGDSRYQGDRFDYDFTNIYRSTQDLDIVVDGTLQQREEFESLLKDKFPYFLSGKTGWEVRSLRHSSGQPGEMGYKEALLDSFDFLNQDTDSNSTGMIEITRKPNEAVVRDLREWDRGSDNHFLNDSVLGLNTFYRSRTHFQTGRAKAGENPEIFSVIRALTKAFQYELSFSPADLREMQDIINHFAPDQITGAGKRRFLDMGKKLFKHAVNLEYAWNTLEHMGLRTKLMQFDDKNIEDSLAWWMNKEPLRAYTLGNGSSKTARELGIDIVAHETKSFLAYESITRAHTGDANVFISRGETAGEAAAYGKGFYTQVGREGARGTGLTIRFHLRPEARLGTDFNLGAENKYIIVLNKAALKVIPESLNMTVLEYLRLILQGKDIDRSDRAIFEKMRRRLSTQALHISAQDDQEIKKILKTVLRDPKSENSKKLIIEFLNFSVSQKYFDLKDPKFTGLFSDRDILRAVLQIPIWSVRLTPQNYEAIESQLKKVIQEGEVKDQEDAMDILVRMPTALKNADYFMNFIQKSRNHNPVQSFARSLGGAGVGYLMPEVALAVLNHPSTATSIPGVVTYKNIFDHGDWKQHSGLLLSQLKNKYSPWFLFEFFLKDPMLSKDLKSVPNLEEKVAKAIAAPGDVTTALLVWLSSPWAKKYPRVLKLVYESGRRYQSYFPHVLGSKSISGKPYSLEYPEIVEAMVNSGDVHLQWDTIEVLKDEGWEKRLDLMIRLIETRVLNDVITAEILPLKNWHVHASVIASKMMESGETCEAVLR